MKNKILILIIFFCAFEISTAQSKQINEGVYKFEINKKYELVEKENNELHFTHFDQAGKLKILQKIRILESGINPKKNNIKEISDFANFETISFGSDEFYKKEDEVAGMTKIKNFDVFYFQKRTRKFKNSELTALQEYTYTTQYYFFFNKKIYQLVYTSDLMTSVMKEYDEYEVDKKMKKVNNLGDINLILETLKTE
ncbi:hypothetical protein D9V96_001010 [Zobellia laminariae]|uniref:hypothetical protein n=1 Tax=Zobellia laminariae TaxID=248906 RepID=UPI004056AA58